MKRQLGTMLTAGMLLCASLAWSQSSDTGSSQSGSSGSSQSGSSSSSQSGSSSSFQPLFTNSSPSTDAQNGSGDSTQSGGTDTTQTGSLGPQDTFTHPEQLPALDLFSDTVSHAGIAISTNAGSFLQRVSYSGANPYWDGLSGVGAGISIAQARSNYGWQVAYNGGLNFTSGYSNNFTELNQSGYGNVSWNLTQRWQLRIKDSYFYSDDPFTPFFTSLGTPTPNNPNPTVYYPQAIIEQNQANLDLTYQLSPHDIVNFSGGESFQRYLRGGYSSLYNSVSYTEGAFYQHAYSNQLAFGGGYQFNALDFGHGQSRAGVNTFEGFISYVFNSHVQASLWIGPELTNTKDVIPVFCYANGCFDEIQHASSWSVAEGGTFKWQISPRDTISAMGSRGVSNAGGILGAASIYQFQGTYSRPLTRAWTLGAALNYSNSNSVYSYRAAQYLKSFTGTVGVSRKLFNDAWNMNAYFALIHQNQNYFGLAEPASTSGLGFTIRYVWAHGLGR